MKGNFLLHLLVLEGICFISPFTKKNRKWSHFMQHLGQFLTQKIPQENLSISEGSKLESH